MFLINIVANIKETKKDFIKITVEIRTSPGMEIY